MISLKKATIAASLAILTASAGFLPATAAAADQKATACTDPKGNCGTDPVTGTNQTTQVLVEGSNNGSPVTANGGGGGSASIIQEAARPFTGSLGLVLGTASLGGTDFAPMQECYKQMLDKTVFWIWAKDKSTYELDKDNLAICKDLRADHQQFLIISMMINSSDPKVQAAGLRSARANPAYTAIQQGMAEVIPLNSTCNAKGGRMDALGGCEMPLVTKEVVVKEVVKEVPANCPIPQEQPKGKVMNLCMEWSKECPRTCLKREKLEVRKVGSLEMQPNGTRGTNASDLRFG